MDKFAGQTSGWDQHISMGPGYSCSKKEKTWSHGLIINFIKCSSFHIFYGTSIFLGTSVFPWDQYTSMGPAYFLGTSILLWDQYTSLGPVFYNRTEKSDIHVLVQRLRSLLQEVRAQIVEGLLAGETHRVQVWVL